MTNLSKKSLLAVLVTALLSVVCAFCAINYVGSAKADGVVIPEEYVQATEGFTVLDSARVNITEEKSGIKFETEITQKAYKDLTAQGEVEFIAVATNVASSKQLAVAFKNLPAFETSEDAETDLLNTYLNYDKIDENKASEIYATDIKVETYAKITNGATVSYVKAMNAPQRAMRVVANAAWLNYKDVDTDGFELVDVEKYFALGERASASTGYSVESGKAYFALPASYTAPKDGTEVTAYVGAKAFTAKYNAVIEKFVATNVPEIGESETLISVFAEDGKVYTAKATIATEITKANLSDIITATQGDFVFGTYVLTEDVDFDDVTDKESWAWKTGDPKAYFRGTFDGLGHTLSDFNGQGIFYSVRYGGIVKNLNVVDATYSGTGLISGGANTQQSTIENCVFIVKSATAYRKSLLGYQDDGVATLKNIYVSYPASTSTSMGMIASHAVHGLTFDNVYMIGGNEDVMSTTLNSSATSHLLANATINGVAAENGNGATLLELQNGVSYHFLKHNGELKYEGKTLPANIQKAVDDNVIPVGEKVDVTADNFDVLQTATNGYYMLADDINYGEVELTDGVWSATATFSGVLNGNGKTISAYKNHQGGLFHTFAGKVKNLTITDIDRASVQKGLFGFNGNTTKDVAFENCVFSYKSTAWRSSLIGYQTSGNAFLKNVYIESPTALSNASGFITCHAFSGYHLENVYMVAPGGKMHATEYLSTQEAHAYDENKIFGNNYNVYTATTVVDAIETAPQFIKDAYAKLHPAV